MPKLVALLASGIAFGAILTLVALGFVVLYKATGVINFAHGDLMTLGAYVAYWAITTFEVPVLVGYGVAIVGLFVVGVVLERIAYAPLRDRPPLVIVISTLAASVVIQGAIALWQGSTPKSLPGPVGNGAVEVLGADIAVQRLLIVGVVAVVVAAVLVAFQRTSLGRQVRALASDRETARLYGARARMVSMVIFGSSAALAALAGVLVGPLSALNIRFGFTAMVSAFAAVVLGGFESLWGTVIAAFGIGILQQVVGGYFFPSYADTLPFIVMFVVIAVRPEGLVVMRKSRL